MDNIENKSFWSNRYILEKILGEGGMGKVYLATDSLTKQLVAIKECTSSKERLQREYYYMKNISHDNLVKALDFFIIENNYYIVMEYVDGMDLKSFIMYHKNSISIKKQIEIAQGICSAVAVLNENGIIHRDIKPENVLLMKNSLKPKLLDLGIAKNLDDQDFSLTRKGAVIGTPQYMSPEQFNGKIFPNTDVFLLGILLYQFFSWSDNSPFNGNNYLAIVNNVSNTELPLLFPKSMGMPYIQLAAVIHKSLEKESAHRIQSAKDLCLLLNTKKLRNKVTSVKKVPLTINKSTRKKRQDHQLRKQSSHIIKPQHIIGTITIVVLFIFIIFSPNKEKEIEVYLAKAEKAFMDKQYDESMKYYEKILELDPSFKRAQEATFYITKEKKIQELLLKAKEAFTQKKYEEAKKYYQDAFYLNDKLEEISLGLQEIAVKEIELKDKLKKAMDYYETGNRYYNQGKYQLAEDNYNKSIELNPEYALAYNSRGLSYDDQKKFDLAEQDYNKAIELDPKCYSAYNNRGYVYYEQRKYDLAEQDYNKAIELEPKLVSAYNNRGLLYYEQIKFDLAEQNYNKAIELEPNFANAYYNRGLVYDQQQKHDLASKNYDIAIKLESRFVSAYSNRGIFFYNQGKLHLAILDWEKAISLGAPRADIEQWIKKAREMIEKEN